MAVKTVKMDIRKAQDIRTRVLACLSNRRRRVPTVDEMEAASEEFAIEANCAVTAALRGVYATYYEQMMQARARLAP